jgi:hypothetical protein
MNNLQNAASEVSSIAYANDTKKAFDPMTILMIVNIIIGIARLIEECKLNRKEVRGRAENLKSTDRLKVGRIIRRNLRKNKYPDLDRADILDGLCKFCYNHSDDEVEQIIQDSINDTTQ